jgi:hypothetical protein
LLTAELTALDNAPANLQVRPVVDSVIETAAAGTSVIEVTMNPLPLVGEYVYVMVAVNIPAGIENANNQLVFAEAIEGDGINNTFEVTYPAKFSTLLAGQKVFAEVYRLQASNGGKTPAFSSKIIIA